MKLNKNFITHSVDDEHITVANGKSEFTGLIRSNSTAAFIIEALKNETTPEKIAQQMCDEYDAPYNVILPDVQSVIDTLKKIGAIDE